MPDKECRDLVSVDLLTRRCIEAKIIASMMEEITHELGRATAYNICRRAMQKAARSEGRISAEELGDNTIDSLTKAVGVWSKGGNLEVESFSKTEGELKFKVTRCAYAELYNEMGLKDLGKIISCDRDYGFIEGFNPDIEFSRDQVIMDGAPFCDFAYKMIKKKE